MDYRICVFLCAVISLHLVCFVHSAETSTCYDQDGTPNDNTPCTTSGNATFCCSDEYYCLSNGLCEWQNGTFWTGTCTDKNWTAPSCPMFCDNLGGPAVFECSTSSGTFCCGLSSCCGSKSSSILTLGRVSTIGYITKGVLTPMTPTATTIAVGSTLTAISTDSLTHTGLSITLAATATKIQSGTTSTNLLPDSSTGSIDAPSINTTASVSNNGAIVGDIVGGVVVIGSLLVAIWFLHGQHKRTPEKPPVVEIPQSTSPRPVYHNLNDDWRKKRSRNSEPDELYDGR